MDSPHLLVPIKVQALVIDDIVIQKAGVIQFENQYYANDGRWSPKTYNYASLNSLTPPGPRPFFGATRKYNNRDAQQLVLDPVANKDAIPQQTDLVDDRGVYLHWVLPAGLRRAFTPGSLDFPPLPDHWLIVRFSVVDSNLKTKAWFVDGGALVESSPTSLLFEDTNKYTAKRVGKIVPFEDFDKANSWERMKTTINALGNNETGSPTFTASIAENRNILSWHDKLEDLRAPDAKGKVREGTTLTYCVLGWYRTPASEPLAAKAAKVVERRSDTNKLLGWLVEPLGWSIDAGSTTQANLLQRRSVFHGMVAQINYWSSTTYKGQILGYPGAPLVGGAMGKSKPSFKVGVGNSAEDALVSLVSSEYSGQQQRASLAKEQPNLWKALEAVIYRQSETLVRSWNVASRDTTVHQNSFATHEAGKFWYIQPLSENRGMFPADADKAAAETAAKPTTDQLAKLKELNKLQTEVDAISRNITALQEDLYMRWWKVAKKTRASFDVPEAEGADLRNIASQIKLLRNDLDRVSALLNPLPGELKKKLEGHKLELKYDAAPRFWLPADPVIVIKNCGAPAKHQSSRQHPCRLPEQIITSAKVKVGVDTDTLNTATGVADIAAAAQRYLPLCPPIVKELLNEASIVEQMVRNLVARSLPPSKSFADEEQWSRWTQDLVNDVTWDGDNDSFPRHPITLEPEALNIRPHRLVSLWVKQPWSPLFIDWQITWFPTTEPAAPEKPFGPVWNFDEADFVPLDKKSIPTVGHTVKGRSLLSPIDERIFEEPIETLGKMLKAGAGQQKDSRFPPAVLEVLERYEVVWSETLHALPQAGLMGQALTGFHQALLDRDVTLPRVRPEPARPWTIKHESVKALETEVRELLDIPITGVSGEHLAPPLIASTTVTPIPFSLIRAGALRIDELWLIDDFGQSADLLGMTPARSASSGQVFHPRMRWHDDPKVFAMPPRVLQPVRLNFRFTAATDENSGPALNSIFGWIFHNPLDQALVLCDRNGELLGHLAIVKAGNGFRISWEAAAGGVALNNIADPGLKAFAESLIQTTPAAKPKLLELLSLIDKSLERIRPAASRRDTVLVGRPLALVSASVGLELFGKAWGNPQQRPLERPATGDQKLDALQVRVDLGYAHSVEDGLIGYFKNSAYNRIVDPRLTDEVGTSDYITNQNAHGLRVGFSTPEQVTLLMDPWGSVQATCGIVPAKTITLADPELNKTVAHMEASFRVGPVLVQAGRLALPTPTGNKGTWNFSGPLTDQKAAALVALDPRYFSDQPVVATEGRLLLLNDE